jgi:hypothetical protein
MRERNFLWISCFLVILGGVPSVYSIVSDPNSPKPIAQQDLKPGESQERRPASLIPVENALEIENSRNRFKSRSVVVDFQCSSKEQIFEVDGTLVRIRGGDCLNPNWTQYTLQNTSNGFTGSLIFVKNKGFTTDFIELQEGANQFSLQAIDENGKKVTQNFVIRRQPASVAKSQ